MNRYQILQVHTKFREAVRSATNPALRGQDADRLTATFIAAACIKRFNEGFHGAVFKDKLREGAELRVTNPAAYEAALVRTAPLLSDLRAIQNELRVVETLTSSDLTYALGTSREIERDRSANPFVTGLYNIVRRRTVTDLIPVTVSSGVDLADPFLAFRAEGTPHKKTSWTGRTGQLSINNMELGFELTTEMLMSDKFGEFLDAQEELGRAAARTRAWVIVDAARRDAERISIPTTGSQGPSLANITAIDAYLGYRTIDGRDYTRTLTDLYVPGQWRAVANTARNTQSTAPQGGASGAATQVSTTNPFYQAYDVHTEEILSRMDVTAYAGHAKSDYIAADRAAEPIEFATLAGYEGGARMLTRLADIVEFDTLGSFDRHLIEFKASDWTGAQVRDKSGLLIIAAS